MSKDDHQAPECKERILVAESAFASGDDRVWKSSGRTLSGFTVAGIVDGQHSAGRSHAATILNSSRAKALASVNGEPTAITIVFSQREEEQEEVTAPEIHPPKAEFLWFLVSPSKAADIRANLDEVFHTHLVPQLGERKARCVWLLQAWASIAGLWAQPILGIWDRVIATLRLGS